MSEPVTVSMPYFECPGLVERAVKAVLAQTVDVHLVLVVDGCEAPKLSVRDSRLTVHQLSENHGRYFVDAMVFEATNNYWFSIHDADDISEPNWLESLMVAHQDGAAVLGSIHVYNRDTGVPSIQKMKYASQPPGPRMFHVAHHFGLFSRKRIRRAGGWDPAIRVGYDTLLMNMLRMTGPVGVVDSPLYHMYLRHGSLTQNPKTGINSPYRKARRAYLERIHAKAYRMYRSGKSDNIPGLIARNRDKRTHEKMLEEAERLKGLIS